MSEIFFTVNMKVLSDNNITINEFMTLMKIHQNDKGVEFNYNITPDIIKNLDEKNLVKLVEKDNKIIKCKLREKSKILIINSLENNTKINNILDNNTKSNRSINQDIEEHIDIFRNKFKNTKPGSMGSKKNCILKLQRWMKENPEYCMKEILKAVDLYIRSLNRDYRFIQQADYFIFKKDNKEESSRLSAFIDEIEFSVEEDWTNTLK